jgi:hypothetical protein
MQNSPDIAEDKAYMQILSKRWFFPWPVKAASPLAHQPLSQAPRVVRTGQEAAEAVSPLFESSKLSFPASFRDNTWSKILFEVVSAQPISTGFSKRRYSSFQKKSSFYSSFQY